MGKPTRSDRFANLFGLIRALVWVPAHRRLLLMRRGVHRDQLTLDASDGAPLLLDLFRPAGQHAEKPLPLLIWIHGGAWTMGSRKLIQPGILRQVKRGYAVASVSYRLSDQAHWPQQLHDVQAAIRHLVDYADTLGLDAHTILLAGESAGGQLAAIAALHPDTVAAVSGVLALYPAADLAALYGASPTGARLVGKLLGPPRETVLARSAQAGIAAHLTANPPPLMVLHGGRDTIVPIEQSHALRAAWADTGAPATLIEQPGYVHGDLRFNRRETMRRVEQFIDDPAARR